MSREVTLVITSCNRFDLLKQTIESFLEFNSYPIQNYLLIEDSPNEQVHDVVRPFRRPFKVLLNNPPIGQIASIDKIYSGIRTPYIFHCEDDWRFFRSGFIEESIPLLETFPELSFVGIRSLGQNEGNDRAFLKAQRREHNGIQFRVHEAEPPWGGYSFNPGLRRLRDYRKLPSFAHVGHEREISFWFVRQGMRTANLENPACETIGGTRHVGDPFKKSMVRTASVEARAKRRDIDLIERDLQVTSRGSFSKADAAFLTELPALVFAAAFLKEPRWEYFSRAIERIKTGINRAKPRKRADKISAAFGIDLAKSRKLADDSYVHRSEHRIQVLKELIFGWKPKIKLEGEKELRSALKGGKGAILWVAHTAFNTQATKMALHRAGHSVSHLSRPEHGFSKSRFGIRFLNPLRCKAETRYLKQRVIIDRASPGAAMNRAAELLSRNEIISITAGAWEGRHLARCELFGGIMTLATGAPALAHRTGAKLLPVFTFRERNGKPISVRIGPAIDAANGPDREEAIRQSAREFTGSLEFFICRHPAQWRGWDDWNPGAAPRREPQSAISSSE